MAAPPLHVYERINRAPALKSRKLLIIGANAVLRFARKGSASSTMWASSLLARKPHKVVAVALANKMARISWVLLARHEAFRAKAA